MSQFKDRVVNSSCFVCLFIISPSAGSQRELACELVSFCPSNFLAGLPNLHPPASQPGSEPASLPPAGQVLLLHRSSRSRVDLGVGT